MREVATMSRGFAGLLLSANVELQLRAAELCRPMAKASAKIAADL
jgi:hypothetical protein